MANISGNKLLNSTILDVNLTGIKQMDKFRANLIDFDFKDDTSGSEPGVYFIFEKKVNGKLGSLLYIGSTTRDVRTRVRQNINADSGGTFRKKYVDRQMIKKWNFESYCYVKYIPYNKTIISLKLKQCIKTGFKKISFRVCKSNKNKVDPINYKKRLKIKSHSNHINFKKSLVLESYKQKVDILKDEHLAIGLFQPPYND